ncbi:winged helix-turn-helix domain-containing protein [Streptomyces sp. WAC05374]|uniref:winged helix-turn-helix domain-containing protein n=1 Tax=Streptomyces sp. WAC05374 TaxID=2487420 RepID=UPI0028A93032|nr:winged helix-turn-helix domain-containing protein [Streptomyces sp. WAC05374]
MVAHGLTAGRLLRYDPRHAVSTRGRAGRRTSAVSCGVYGSRRRSGWTWDEGGPRALRSQGPPSLPRLSVKQFAQLQAELAKGPAVHGWEGQRWTLARVKTVIGRRFHLTYTIRGVRKLLVRIGWSCQVPARRAVERDDDEVAGWVRRCGPARKPRGGPWWGERPDPVQQPDAGPRGAVQRLANLAAVTGARGYLCGTGGTRYLQVARWRSEGYPWFPSVRRDARYMGGRARGKRRAPSHERRNPVRSRRTPCRHHPIPRSPIGLLARWMGSAVGALVRDCDDALLQGRVELTSVDSLRRSLQTVPSHGRNAVEGTRGIRACSP